MPWFLRSHTLCSLSAILTSLALNCRDLAPRSCASFLLVGLRPSSSVRSATRFATSSPKLPFSSRQEVLVASRVSWTSAAWSVGRSRMPTSARIRATAIGWLMYGVCMGSLRVWCRCLSAAKTIVRSSCRRGCASVLQLVGRMRGGLGSGSAGSPPAASASTRMTSAQPRSQTSSPNSGSSTWQSLSPPRSRESRTPCGLFLRHTEVTRGPSLSLATCVKKSTWGSRRPIARGIFWSESWTSLRLTARPAVPRWRARSKILSSDVCT
mmetsp:Transcript_15883/g.47654  ORF Transcript_15883/g.47654 Transcript_15883/m.47654 type:complete len:267 (+) Transcript_15883:1026-1826(+)